MKATAAIPFVVLMAAPLQGQERDDEATAGDDRSAARPNDGHSTSGEDAPPDSTPAPTLWQPGNSTTSSVEPHVAADDSSASVGDGAYGRFEGDVDLGMYAGAELDEGGASGLVALSAHYYWMAGATLTYVDAFGRNDAMVGRLFAVGVDVRPAFVPRWAEGHQHGTAITDLIIDSISLGVGIFWASPPDRTFGEQRGFEASAGFGVPLFVKAEGLWFQARGALRWADPSSGDDAAVPAALLTLAWHQPVQVR